MNRPIEIYQTQDGQTQVDVRFEQESVWLSIDDMVHLFQKSRSTVNEHILNIYKEKELVFSKIRLMGRDGKGVKVRR